jgi:NTP pyrophosphatase (non-canonical NTP hydrolase)
MEVKEFQKICVKITDELDVKYNVKRDPQLNMVQLMEELGEICEEINKKKLRTKEPNIENLKGEIADVVLLLAKMAEMYDIDLEEAVKNKVAELKKRNKID